MRGIPESHMLQVFDLSDSGQLVDAAMRSVGLTSRQPRRHPLMPCSQARSESRLDLSRQIIDSVLKSNPLFFTVIEETPLGSGDTMPRKQ